MKLVSHKRENTTYLAASLSCATHLTLSSGLLNPPRLKRGISSILEIANAHAPIHVLTPCPHLLDTDEAFLVTFDVLALRLE